MSDGNSEVGTVEGLFGPQPAERVRGRGRPAHAWDRRNSLRICNLLACGRTVAEVAAVLGLSQPTLRKVYFSEIAARGIMALKVKSEQMVRLTEAAIAGNVAAEKALAGMIQAEQIKVHAQDLPASRRKAAAAEPKMGKKDEARFNAARAEGKFGRRPAPTMIQ